MTRRKRILVTGSAGRVGQGAVQGLVQAGHEVHGLDVRPTPGLPAAQVIFGDLADGEKLRTYFQGMDAVVHLAATPDDMAFPRQPPPHDTDNFLSQLLPNNIVGLYHVLEAARQTKLPRLILASTGQVVWQHVENGPWPLDQQTPFSPRYWYACTKVFLEMAAMAYSREHALTILVVRLGWCPRDQGQAQEIAQQERFQDVYLSPGDAGRFFARAVEAESLPLYSLLYCTSRPTHLIRYDLIPAKELIGYLPKDQWPTGALVDSSALSNPS